MVLRVHGEEFVFSSNLHQVPARVPQMNMMKVHIPFTFKLLETSKSSYSGKHAINLLLPHNAHFVMCGFVKNKIILVQKSSIIILKI